MGRKSREKIMAEAKQPETAVDTSSPAFMAAVEAATKAAMATAIPDLVAQIASQMGQQPAPAEAGGGDIVSRLALAIADLTDQGSGRKRTAPDILLRRKEAYDRMIVLLKEVRETKAQPRYALRAKCYIGERVLEPWKLGADKKQVQTEVIFHGIPNDAFKPLNDIAKAIFKEYEGWIGGAIEKPIPDRATYMTPGGLIVVGEATSRSVVAHGLLPRDGDDIQVANDPHDPTAPEINVLGTIAPAAKQNYQGAVGH